MAAERKSSVVFGLRLLLPNELFVLFCGGGGTNSSLNKILRFQKESFLLKERNLRICCTVKIFDYFFFYECSILYRCKKCS